MARRPNHEDMDRLYQAIEDHMGERIRFFARYFEWHPEKVARHLLSMETVGMLVSEDERGGLWPFRRI